MLMFFFFYRGRFIIHSSAGNKQSIHIARFPAGHMTMSFINRNCVANLMTYKFAEQGEDGVEPCERLEQGVGAGSGRHGGLD